MELSIQYAGDYQRAYMDAYGIANADTARVNCYKLLRNATIRQQVDSGLNELANIRKQATIEATKEHVKEIVLSRERCLEITSKIALGSARRIDVSEQGKPPQKKTIVPSDTERLKAIEMLWKMQNFDGLDEDKLFGVIKPELPKTK